MAYTHINPGEEIEISAHIYHGEGDPPVAELVALPMEELDRMEQASIDKEHEIFKAMCDLQPQWSQQAKVTRRIREAKAYLRVKPVAHTSNAWRMFDTFRHEKSNMVYKMVWWVNERTEYNRGLQKSVTVAWDLRWYICYNTIQNPDKTGRGWQIAGQDSKVFKDKAALDKYLQGRITAYAHLFQEISPPIPKGEEGRFSVNGVLLPGYTVEVPEQTPREAADELLALLDDEDMPLTQPPEPKAPPAQPTPKKAPAHKPKKHTPTR